MRARQQLIPADACEQEAFGERPADVDAEALEDRRLAELTDRFAHRVRFFAYRVERRFGLDPQWRDDLVSAGYWGLLKALRNRRVDAHDRELSAYVSKRIEGAAIDEARRILSRLTSQVDFDPVDLDSEESSLARDGDVDFGLHPHDPESEVDRAGRWRQIEAAIGQLDAGHQRILRAYVEGNSISEIARSEGDSAGRLQNQMTRIARQLRARSPELRRLLRQEI